jgi:hypothetical protein
MRDSLKIIMLALLVSILVRGFDVGYVVAALQGHPTIWNSAWELDPVSSDPMGQGDDHIRNLKREIRGRAETEHTWGTTFFDPNTPTALTVTDFFNGTTGAEDSALDEGRLWVDSGNGNTLYVYESAFEEVVAIPTDAIILWDDPNGDEDCDGGETAGDCPCGFTRAAEFDGLTVRGALAVGGDPNDTLNVPDIVGVTCSDPNDVGASCNASADEYDDTLDTAEMPAHDHQLSIDIGAVVHTSPTRVAGGAVTDATDSDAMLNTGGGGAHYHPFRTVIFCRKS